MPDRTNSVGRHLPTSGGLGKTVAAAKLLGCETIQVFVSNPQAWAMPAPRTDVEEFAAGVRELDLYPTVAHAKYLINLASPKDELRDRSVQALADELLAAGRVGLDLVVVHAGSHGGDGDEAGLERLVAGLERAREVAEDAGRAAEPVVENSVGAGTQVCSSFGALAEVARRAGVRVCVDTAHMFVAGYDLAAPDGARAVAADLRETLGPALALLHLNDARHEVGSHRDGHSKVGQGSIPEGAWPELFAGLPGVPMVMETPYEGDEADAAEVRFVKDLAGGLRKAAGEG